MRPRRNSWDGCASRRGSPRNAKGESRTSYLFRNCRHDVAGRGHLIILRRMSRSVAGALQSGQDPALQAAMVKDAGAVFEQEIPEIARSLIGTGSASGGDPNYAAVLAYTILHSPSFSLRGGTREILRGIIARGLGLR